MNKYPNQFYIFGKTTSGKKFRPSDWAERLCGVLSSYRPKNDPLSNLNSQNLGYSPYAHPQNYDGEKVVFINREIEKLDVKKYIKERIFAGTAIEWLGLEKDDIKKK